METKIKKYLIILIIFYSSKNSNQLTGLQKAIKLIQSRKLNFHHTNDLLLKNKIIAHERKCYDIQRLKQVIGIAWEFVFTDFGFSRIKICSRGGCAYDLINRRTKTIIELKNNYLTDSGKAKKYTMLTLEKYKRNNPNFTVIYASINYKDNIGKEKIKNGVLHFYGTKFLNRYLGIRKNYIITTLRNCIQI